jgi:Ca2+-binding RTX toxin-like protein
LATISKIIVGTTGRIDGGIGVDVDSPVSITNHGRISADAYPMLLWSGADTLINFGKIICLAQTGDQIFFGQGDDTIINSGKIVTRGISTYEGADTFINFQKIGHTIKSGTFTGRFDLGPDNDTFKGGNKAETVVDGAGADHYSFGGGNDTYWAFGGDTLQDTVNGGKGIDTYSMGDSTDASLSISVMWSVSLRTVSSSSRLARHFNQMAAWMSSPILKTCSAARETTSSSARTPPMF